MKESSFEVRIGSRASRLALAQVKEVLALLAKKKMRLNGEQEIFALTRSIDETDAFIGKTKLSDLPKGAKIGTSSTIRQQAIESLNPHAETISIRGTIDERISLVDQGKIDGIIV